MDLPAARKLARTLMDQHGLADWQFVFDRARRRFGVCRPRNKTIGLSAYLVHLNSDEEVRDTILHEIAHALTPGDNHGDKWKAACVRIGAKPERCFKEDGEVRTVAAKLKIGCPVCGVWASRHRITWAMQVCRKCRKPIVWEHVRTGRRYQIQRSGRGYEAIEMAA